MGFKQEEEKAIWKILASILHLGNFEFDDSNIYQEGGFCNLLDNKSLEIVSKLLKINSKSFLDSLIYKKIRYPGESEYIKTPLKKRDCN